MKQEVILYAESNDLKVTCFSIISVNYFPSISLLRLHEIKMVYFKLYASVFMHFDAFFNMVFSVPPTVGLSAAVFLDNTPEV